MVNEVNNIIYNTLIAERSIHLPGVGTLSVVRKSAEMASSDLIMPPSYTVEFSSYGTATSIVDAIAFEGEVDIIKAEDIYSRWLDRVRTGSTILIEGVGRLQNKSFVVDPIFIALFNNAGNKPIKVGRKKKGGMVAIILVILFAAIAVIGGLSWYFYDDIETMLAGETTATSEEVLADEPIVEDEVVAPADEESVTIEVEEPQEEVIPVVETPTEEPSNDWTQSADIRHWVVAGSYSTEQNANTAMNILMAEHDGVQCKIVSLGKMYAVAIYGSVEREECVQFVRDMRDDIENMWIFTPKKYQ